MTIDHMIQMESTASLPRPKTLEDQIPGFSPASGGQLDRVDRPGGGGQVLIRTLEVCS
ncbi:hypothetical protein PGT21_037182 [Puccinia graminis f. sp. tritici]|uniref:Uncharacterized protein n=1 Tax=Puccinia graminis f. sp. tritici TaxID=56615 RepID=A0A5B0R3P0_PUCGR|nr:hypothetical protein PGT21_037182 [Puccinia graminis f. sp. tritici]